MRRRPPTACRAEADDLVKQAFIRLAIVMANRDCDKDNDVMYHFNDGDKRYEVTIKVDGKPIKG